MTWTGSNGLGESWTKTASFAGNLYLPAMEEHYITLLISETYDGEPAQGAYGDGRILFLRSTDRECYVLTWLHQKELLWQNAPIGTSWTNSSGGELRRIQTIETVIVPAGIFTDCIKIKVSDIEESPDVTFYEWIKPGLGIIKIEDYHTRYLDNPNAAPIVYELQSVPDE